MSKITRIEIDDSALPPPTPEIEQERRVAIFDLLPARRRVPQVMKTGVLNATECRNRFRGFHLF